MHTPTIIIQAITLEQLLEAMRPVIRHELAHIQSMALASQQPTSDDLLTIKQAAEMLDVSVATVHEYKRRGMLSYQKIAGRSYIMRSAVLAAGTQHQRTAKPSREKGKPSTTASPGRNAADSR